MLLSPASTPAVSVRDLTKSYRLWRTPTSPLSHRILRTLGRTVGPASLRRNLERRAQAEVREFRALEGVSFEVARGESMAVVGRNGSGKSTLLEIVAGTLAPTAGEVSVDGRVAALLQLGAGFHPEFTGRENARLSAAVLGLPRDEIEAGLPAMEAFADIGDFLDQPVRTYSSGMLLRLAFAVSVTVRPDVLLMDEVLAVGDPGFQFKCLQRLRQLQAAGVTVLLVSHDLVAVRNLCDRAVYLEGGRCRAVGATTDVVEQFLLDLRDEQRRAAGTTGVTPRLSLRPGAPASFGTDEGRILQAVFADTGSSRTALAKGDTAEVVVTVAVSAAVEDAFLTLAVLSARMIPIGGTRVPVPRCPPEPDPATRVLRFRFPVGLTGGHYFLTLRLERGDAPTSALLIEKQTAALEMEVVSDGADSLLGFFDLGIRVAGEVEARGPRRSVPEAAGAPFVVGVPRSGTTLLRMMLDSHPQLAIPPETGFLPAVAALPPEGEAARERFRDVVLGAESWPDFHLGEDALAARLAALVPFTLTAGLRAFYGLYAERFGKARWGDKTPSHGLHMPEILRLLPEARFVHVIRDGRDVLASVRPLWFAPGTSVEAIARDWAERIGRTRELSRECPHYLEVRYEDLVREPEATLREVCGFLALPFHPGLLAYHRRSAERLLEHEGRRRADGSLWLTREDRQRQQSGVTRPPDPSRIGRWREVLTAEEAARFHGVAGEMLGALGYEEPAPRLRADALSPP
jgi:lipopolysaccharide transport system ATP-binding protein